MDRLFIRPSLPFSGYMFGAGLPLGAMSSGEVLSAHPLLVSAATSDPAQVGGSVGDAPDLHVAGEKQKAKSPAKTEAKAAQQAKASLFTLGEGFVVIPAKVVGRIQKLAEKSTYAGPQERIAGGCARSLQLGRGFQHILMHFGWTTP